LYIHLVSKNQSPAGGADDETESKEDKMKVSGVNNTVGCQAIPNYQTGKIDFHYFICKKGFNIENCGHPMIDLRYVGKIKNKSQKNLERLYNKAVAEARA